MKKTLGALLVSASLFAAGTMPAFSDIETETYVRENANAALQTLNDPDLDSAQRREAFKQLMDQFTDLDLIAMRVLGKYYKRFTPEELDRFEASFREYALATYEAQLDRYRGSEIIVKESEDKAPSKNTLVDSTVETQIELPGTDLTVKWRVVKFQPTSRYAQVFGTDFKVVEVGLALDGGFLWLAGEQKAQFQAILDRNNGKADKLIAKIDEMTAKLNQTAQERRTALENGTLAEDAIQAG